MYIPGKRNKVADGLSRTLFPDENCLFDADIEKASAALNKEGAEWVWKDGKGGYQEFLDRLQPDQWTEVVEQGTLSGENVFQVFSTEIRSLDPKSDSWDMAYKTSVWFGATYNVLSDMTTDSSLKASEFSQALDYRIDSKGIL